MKKKMKRTKKLYFANFSVFSIFFFSFNLKPK